MGRVTRAIVAIVAGGAVLATAPAALAADAPYDKHTVIVKYADSASGRERLDTAAAAGVVKTLGTITGFAARLVYVNGDPKTVAARLNASPAVLYAEPNFIYRSTATPADPRYPELYGLNNTGQDGGLADADIDAPEGWTAAGLGAFPATGGAKVGIVDTGIQADHPDLSGKLADCAGVNSFGVNLVVITLFADPTIVAGKCADDNGHGTHVSGTIGAKANNNIGVTGVAFNSPISMCKALDSSGSGTVAGIANCITYLNQHGAKIISMSLGGSGSTTLQNAVAAATANGSLLIAAAGNSGDSTISYPAGYSQVVSVAAVDRRGARASFSTFNSDVEVAAPGVDILSTWMGSTYKVISGTSMATPHAAGVAAIIAARTSGGPPAWRTRLDRTADDLGPAGRDSQFGFGRVNLNTAVTAP
ncbi:MAG: thermitase [Solirubrobacteraceae bacterium]|jgi:thermitase|nr:thermitase [Solirubrobacteraceae bacterium]